MQAQSINPHYVTLAEGRASNTWPLTPDARVQQLPPGSIPCGEHPQGMGSMSAVQGPGGHIAKLRLWLTTPPMGVPQAFSLGGPSASGGGHGRDGSHAGACRQSGSRASHRVGAGRRPPLNYDNEECVSRARGGHNLPIPAAQPKYFQVILQGGVWMQPVDLDIELRFA